ncbi:MAG: threonylcarbamoyl-AMP synthase [Bacteroidetes bacterium]|nr:threonylcarbamoyl-AMP synthase [Bacteroidota bacterium]
MVLSNFESDIQECLSVLNNGGLILYPTDTVWGIGCDATNPIAVQNIFDLKQRADHKALLVLVAEKQDILKYVVAPDIAIFNYLESCEHPITVIYQQVIGLAGTILGQDGSAGIRICKDPFCNQLIKRFNKPIVSTSANVSGMPTPLRFSTIDARIVHGVDYVVKWRQHQEKDGQPSKIIRWNGSNIEVLRP